MADPINVPLSYDEILLLAMALESYADECRAAARTLRGSPEGRQIARHLDQQIADAEGLIRRLNEARR